MTKNEAIQSIIDLAVSQIGYPEGPNNWTKYAEELDAIDGLTWGKKQNLAWCGEFILWNTVKTFGVDLGLKIMCSGKPSGIPLCSAGAQYFKDAGRWYTSNPQPGDVIFFNYSGGINHTGLVIAVNGGVITTVEGNSSDKVSRNTYSVGYYSIAGFGRPRYELAADLPAPIIEHPVQPTAPTEPVVVLYLGSRGSDVKKMQEDLISLGYSCGPDGADGVFGRNTLSAVIKFQEEHGLDSDGEAGPLTLTAIEKAIKDAGGEGTSTPPAQEKEFAVGDVVMFTGNSHFVSANSDSSKPCKAGKAKITQIYGLGTAKHPYHLVKLAGGGSTVYGWVNAKDIAVI